MQASFIAFIENADIIPLIIQTFFIFGLAYLACRPLRISYEDAAVTAQIVASNHFEVVIAVALAIYGTESVAALATVVGVLIEVPIMLALVRFCIRTKHWYPLKEKQATNS